MAKHETPLDAKLLAATIRENMEHRFSHLYSTEDYNGQHAGEFAVCKKLVGVFSVPNHKSRNGAQRNGGGVRCSPSSHFLS